MLETCGIVVDVGGVFDAARHRYDHHQRYDVISYIRAWKDL